MVVKHVHLSIQCQKVLLGDGRTPTLLRSESKKMDGREAIISGIAALIVAMSGKRSCLNEQHRADQADQAGGGKMTKQQNAG